MSISRYVTVVESSKSVVELKSYLKYNEKEKSIQNAKIAGSGLVGISDKVALEMIIRDFCLQAESYKNG